MRIPAGFRCGILKRRKRRLVVWLLGDLGHLLAVDDLVGFVEHQDGARAQAPSDGTPLSWIAEIPDDLAGPLKAMGLAIWKEIWA